MIDCDVVKYCLSGSLEFSYNHFVYIIDKSDSDICVGFTNVEISIHMCVCNVYIYMCVFYVG